MRWYTTITRLKSNQSGVAAIEMALILPVLLLLFLGMIDVTALLSDNRRLSYSANAVADLVSRLETPATSAQIAEAFKAVEVVMRAAQTTDVRVEVHNYRLESGILTKKWTRNNAKGSACSPPSNTGLSSLMAAGNDIIVAVTCATYTPIIAQITGRNIFGRDFTMREQIAVRPRFSLNLDCPSPCS